MHLTVGHKLFLMLVIITGLVAFAMATFMSWSFERGFINYIEERKQERTDDFVQRLENYYRENGSWAPLLDDRAAWLRLIFSDEPHEQDKPPRWIDRLMKESMRSPEPDEAHPDSQRPHLPIDKRVVLLSTTKQQLIGRVENIAELEHLPIEVDGEIVGYAGIRSGPPLERIVEARFLEKQHTMVIWIALATLLFSAALAILIARRLVKPLKAFRRGSRALAAGQYDTRIPVESNDELGQLARDFNSLAAALERTEAQRRQWVADTSHELRTPLSILRGEIEALQDGMRPFDKQAIDSLHGEIMRLNRLIDDLYELAQSDAGSLSYRPDEVDVGDVLEEVLNQYASEFEAHSIKPTLIIDDSTPAVIHADADRLAQLFRNLLANALRYTDSGGRISISTSAAMAGHQIVIDFEDSAPGVPESELEHLFERFYRVESSRNRDSGGAGLGLSICRNIVAAHGGTISAHHSALGGLHVRINLPVSQ